MRELDYEKAIYSIVSAPIRARTSVPYFNKETYELWHWTDKRKKPTWDEVTEAAERLLRNAIADDINSGTDQIIAFGFEFNGSPIYLSRENQFNFSQDYQWKGSLSYPISLKTGRGSDGEPIFTTLNDSDEFTAFYTAGLSHVKNALQDGFTLKASLTGLSGSDLLNFEDPRVIPDAL